MRSNLSRGGKGKTGERNNTLRYVIIGFLIIYGIGQILLLLQSTNIFHSNENGIGSTTVSSASSSSKKRSSMSQKSLNEESTVSDGSVKQSSSSSSKDTKNPSNLRKDTTVKTERVTIQSASLPGSMASSENMPFQYDHIEELDFPDVNFDDGGTSIYSVVAPAYIDATNARQVLLDSRKKEDKDKGGKYDSTPVTVKVPCWTDHRLLWKMGLDRMADDMEEGTIPTELRRSRAPHAYSHIVADLMCTFHSTPISGGLQCCCTSNITLPSTISKIDTQGNDNHHNEVPGTFFCLPSTVIVGARSSGAGLLAAFFQQHAYLRYTRSPPSHAMASSPSLYVVDNIMARYLSYYSSPAILPPGFFSLPRDGRPKAISPWFWQDASPSYFYSISAPILLRKLLPRSKVILMLRDPIERAYTDLVQYIIRQERKDAEKELFDLVHYCAKKTACSEAPNARGIDGFTPQNWEEGVSLSFEKCLIDTLPTRKNIMDLEGVSSSASIVSCASRAIRPGGAIDWNEYYKQYALRYATSRDTSDTSNVLECSAASDPDNTELINEGNEIWKRVVYSLHHQIAGCLDGPDVTSSPVVAPPGEKLLEAIAQAEQRLEECSLTITAGTAIPVPLDLMAANFNGYELGLYAIAAELPKDAKGPGKILLDGDKDGCFPNGVDIDDPVAPLARSLYLRPLQRLHASYGRKVVQIYDTSTLRTDPASIMDPIFESLSVYKPVLEPVGARTDCKLMGWTGEIGECDVRVPVMDERVKQELNRILEPYIRTFTAYLSAAPVPNSSEE